MKRVCIIGAGLAGSYLALLLAEQGYVVDIYERRENLLFSNDQSKRSIGLALSARGIHALSQITGLMPNVMENAQRMFGRRIHSLNKDTKYNSYDANNQGVICAISRETLSNVLITAVKLHSQINLHLGKELFELIENNNIIEPFFSGEINIPKFDFIIGADGAYSRVRAAIQNMGEINFEISKSPFAYKEIDIPFSPNQDEPVALEIWPRKSFMMIGLPNKNKKLLQGTLFMPLKGDKFSFETFATPKHTFNFFREVFPDIKFTIEDAVEFNNRPLGSITCLKGGPWYYKNVILLGDAAHAMSPFLGQGMNCALEDCVLLGEILSQCEGNYEQAFAQFYFDRQSDAEAICELSESNAYEMMLESTTLEYQLKKELEHIIHLHYPHIFTPYYQLITFELIPYKYIEVIKQWQNELLSSCNIELFALNKDICNIDKVLNYKALEIYSNRMEKKFPFLINKIFS
ncbi:FAD-dependent monooxygenase [Acinetobacter oleivorans]|uniref:FAD-dependent oxidoreductase n=1 Tax=Acinetobacter oleivorans TaxID=1148157 RepID=UPI0019029606|nr:NAD(P)/FAD-dependent oxidoreductase [Acinetobacter oleivorans]MBJ9739614.1 FAD-dependent monooxygenase [Acinetobacter oleivorans]MCU4411976.1 FAD-dependent monooxygenase [Acinetobacter oleivorans]